MKQIFFFLVLAHLFVACDKPCNCKGYSVDKNPCRCVVFKGKIGNDFDSALDSLKNLNEAKFIEEEITGYWSIGYYSGGYFIEKEKVNVDFIDDDRAFFYIMFMDSVVTYRQLNRFDVLDEKGNYYLYIDGRKD